MVEKADIQEGREDSESAPTSSRAKKNGIQVVDDETGNATGKKASSCC